ncbi:glutamine amidotransferase [Jiangella anatolica]|uniref:Glutamine amidotransferase n=1 Tax=Jiangella anatolica TaxID=2670374 RepID=A0A2W2B0C5_9ACTN|nr:glutamine amidotransferase [Jiangella anatolica]PZF80861.1 glutamine amidotransferase [Jiangella anatolica]
MCGIAALQVRDPALRPRLGALLAGMTCRLVDRGPDAAGVAVYDEPGLLPAGWSNVSVLDPGRPDWPDAVAAALGAEVDVRHVGPTAVVRSRTTTAALAGAVRTAVPEATRIGRGRHAVTLKGVGLAADLTEAFGLDALGGTQGIAHTRMATESAVVASGSHPFSVDDDLCLVHNGSFSNHATVRRTLRRHGVEFDSDNDSEVAARFIGHRMAAGDTLTEALERVVGVFDGFYTLVVTTAGTLAVLRDPIACKPAVVAETAAWVAVASEYRALAELPGVETARIFEPEPGRVYTWTS